MPSSKKVAKEARKGSKPPRTMFKEAEEPLAESYNRE